MRFVDDFVRFVDFLLQAFNIRTTYPIVKHLKEIPTTTMKKVNALSNKASLGTYLTLALGAGALGSHDTKAAIITSPVNETSINKGDPIFITFSNGVISSGRGEGDVYPGTIKGFSGGGIGKQRTGFPKFIYESYYSTPADWSFVSLQPLPYGTTIDASTPWGGEEVGGQGGGSVYIDEGLSNAYYGLKFYASPGVYNYGWMEVSTPKPGYDLTFGNIAVETTANTSIGAGAGGTSAAPEPSTFAMMALAGGAVALRLLRKKKAA